MTSTPQNSIEYARATYRLDIDERIERQREDTPSPAMGVFFMAALLLAAAALLVLAARCDAAEPINPETAALQAALDEQCTTGTTEERLSCAIDVAQGHGHGMTPDEYARAKQAASMLNGVSSQALQPLAVSTPFAGTVGGDAAIIVEVDALPISPPLAIQGGDLRTTQSTLKPDLARVHIVRDPLGHR